jgi:dihydrofolate reductase
MMARKRSPATRGSTSPALRTVTFGVANSLDNFIARKDHAVDWLSWSGEVSAISAAYWKTIDTVVMGRKTYEIGPSGGYPGVKNYVFSRTLPAGARGGVEVVSQDAAEFVDALRREPGKGICVMGGGLVAKALFEAGLIDELGLNVHPIVLGSGIPLFHEMERQIDLELIECKPFENGCVFLRYRVRR